MKETSDAHDYQQLSDIANEIRILAIEGTSAANSGHPTSASSMAEFLAVCFFDQCGMKWLPQDPKDRYSDRFVLSKGHAVPGLWGAFALAGVHEKKHVQTLRKIDSELEGHPTTIMPFVDIGTGSLGQGLSFTVGMAYSSKYLDKINNKYYCVMGDGESCEGSVWEAANLASYYKLDNIIAAVDCNRLGQSQEAMF